MHTKQAPKLVTERVDSCEHLTSAIHNAADAALFASSFGDDRTTPRKCDPLGEHHLRLGWRSRASACRRNNRESNPHELDLNTRSSSCRRERESNLAVSICDRQLSRNSAQLDTRQSPRRASRCVRQKDQPWQFRGPAGKVSRGSVQGIQAKHMPRFELSCMSCAIRQLE